MKVIEMHIIAHPKLGWAKLYNCERWGWFIEWIGDDLLTNFVSITKEEVDELLSYN